MGIITVYINNQYDDITFSKRLVKVLGFDEYENRMWLREFDNSAYANDMIKALADIGYRWSVSFEIDTPWEYKTVTLSTLEEWAKYYDDDEEG